MSKRNRREKNSEDAVTASPVWDNRSLLLGLVLGLTFFVFANSIISNGFAYDDNTQILKNELIRDLKNIPTVLVTETWFWRYQQDNDPNKVLRPSTPYYRPVFTLYTMLAWQAFTLLFPDQSDPGKPLAFPWHLANVVMHLGVVFLVFLLVEKLAGDVRVAAVASVLFAVHPLRSETVAWISGLTDLIVALLVLPSFYYYLRYREAGRKLHLAGSLGFYLLATFSKEPAIALALFIGAYELFIANPEKPLKDRLKPALIHVLMFIGVSLIYFFMRHYALGFWFNDPSYTRYSPATIAMTIPLVVWKYLGLLVAPINLSIFHSTPMVTDPLSLRFILPVSGLVGLVLLLWRFWGSPAARFGMLWFAVHLLPLLNLGAFDYNFMIQERYLYIPSMGFSMLAALGLAKLPLEKWLFFNRRAAAQAALVAIICLVLGGKTLAQNTVWKNDDALFNHGVEVAHDQPMAHFILAFHNIKYQQKPEQVVASFERYLELVPNDVVVMGNLANARLQMYELTQTRAHLDRAIGLCEKGLALDSQNAQLWATLGHAYTYDTERRNYERARAYLNQALKLEPNMAVATFQIGATYYKEAKYDEALKYLEAARQQLPEFPDTHLFLGYTYAARGQTKEAVDALTLYLQLQPNARDAVQHQQQLEQLRAKLQQNPAE